MNYKQAYLLMKQIACDALDLASEHGADEDETYEYIENQYNKLAQTPKEE